MTMAKMKKYEKYVLPAMFLLIGLVIGILVANWQSIIDMVTSDYKHAIILLEDPNCGVCEKDFQRVVKYVEENVDLGQAEIIRLNPYKGDGKRIYAELYENNVNVLPLILLTDDLTKTKGFKDINTFLVKVGKYYVFRPIWPVRWYAPDMKENRVVIYTDGNVDLNGIERIAFASAPNVIIDEKNREGNYFLLAEGPENVVRNLQTIFPLSEVAGRVMEVPYIQTAVRAEEEIVNGVLAILSRYPNVKIIDANTMDSNTIAVIIQTDHPYILARAFPGAQVYADGLSIPKKATAIIDVYLGTDRDADILNDLSNVMATGRIIVVPHYILFAQGNRILSPLGQKGIDRAILETCAYSIGGANKWFSLASELVKCGNLQNCWEGAARKAGLDVNALFSCYQTAGSQIIQRYVNETAISGITTTAAIVDGWYPYLPGSDLKSIICALLSPPLPDTCRG